MSERLRFLEQRANEVDEKLAELENTIQYFGYRIEQLEGDESLDDELSALEDRVRDAGF